MVSECWIEGFTRIPVVLLRRNLYGSAMASPTLCLGLVFVWMPVSSLTFLHLGPVLVSSPFAQRWFSIGCGVVGQDIKNRITLRTVLVGSTRDRSTWRVLTGLGS